MLSGTGTTITIGPLKSDNFPYILLDRAMVVVWHLANRTHARQDKEQLDPGAMKAALDSIKASTEFWGNELKRSCVAFVKEGNGRTPSDKCTEHFRTQLAKHLESMAAIPFPKVEKVP